MSDVKFIVRRSNDDPLEDTWEWVLIVGTETVALSWADYTDPLAAVSAAARTASAFLGAAPSVTMPLPESEEDS